jgi:hypothetical protein
MITNSGNNQQPSETNYVSAINDAIIQGIGFGLGGIIVVLVLRFLPKGLRVKT